MTTIVHIPSALVSYTGQSVVQIACDHKTLAGLLDALDQQYPGLRFRMIDEQDRIRRHIRIFQDGGQMFEINHGLAADEPVHIIQALSGG